MVTPTELLTLSTWFSPSYPVGAFAYSHGLETAIDRGHVGSADDAYAWIRDALHHGAGWNDALLLCAAYRSDTASGLQDIDDTGRALSACSERLKETDLQGAAFCKTVSQVHGLSLDGLIYPVAIGRAARMLDLPLAPTLNFSLKAFASNLVSVAMRLVPLGQVAGQTVIHDLTACCVALADRAISADLDDLSSSAFLTDIAAMQHETQYSRIFRT